jgi:hypothetical protein
VTEKREPRDVETRLRAALHSYADVVDDGPVPRAERSAAPHRSPLRGWRASVLAAAAALAVVGGTWAVLERGSEPSTTAASGGGEAAVLGDDARAEAVPSTDSSTAADAAAGAAGAAGAASAPTGALAAVPSAEVGTAYPFDLYTHCGILGADVGGVWFAADPQLVQESGPPAGWGNPYQRGTLVLESTDEAVFRDDAGHELELRAVPDSGRPPPCE